MRKSLTVGVTTTLVAVATLVAAPIAFADVDTEECDNANGALGAVCYQYEILRTSPEVRLSDRTLVLRRDPGPAEQVTASVTKTVQSAYKVTNAIADSTALTWAFGGSGKAGKITTPVTKDAEFEFQANGSASATGTTTVTRTSEVAITWTSDYTLTYPAVPARRGYRVYTYVIGKEHEVNQRRCVKDLLGVRCGEWQTMTVREPTGIEIEEVPLGWSAQIFQACKPGVVNWTAYEDPSGESQVGRPSHISCVHLDLTQDRYRITADSGLVIGAGRLKVTSSREDPRTRDLEEFTVRLLDEDQKNCTLRVVRDPKTGPATFRTGRMNGTLTVWTGEDPNIPRTYHGSINVVDWQLD